MSMLQWEVGMGWMSGREQASYCGREGLDPSRCAVKRYIGDESKMFGIHALDVLSIGFEARRELLSPHDQL